MTRIYISNVIECLRILESREIQLRLWNNGGDTESCSLEELLCQLYDDTGLGDALSNGTIVQELGFEAASALHELDAAIEEINNTLPTHVLIDCPEMARVRRLAANAISRLPTA